MQIDFGEVVNQLAVMAIIIATGYIIKKIKIINENGEKNLSSLVVNVTSPALILSSLSGTPDKAVLKNVVIIVLVTVCILSFSYLASSLVLRIKGVSESEKVIYHFCMMFSNAAFLGFPLCYGLFGKTGLLYASVYSAVQDTFFWSVGVGILVGSFSGSRFKNLINANMIAIIIGFILLIFKVQLPVFAEKALTTVGSATVPIALMIVGFGFFNVKFNLISMKQAILPVVYKLIIVPVIVGLVLSFLNLEITVKYILLLEISMPTAASTVVLARNFEKDYILASKLVILTTGMSMATLPLLVLTMEKLL